MNRFGLSIRTILLLTISALTLLIAVFAVQGLYVEWQRLDKITTLKNATRISDTLFDANEKLSVERDIALTLLSASDEESLNKLKPRLLESRAQADAAMHAVLQSLARYDFSELPQFQKEITAHLSEIQALRQEIDDTIAHAHRHENPNLAKRWYDAVTELNQKAEDLWLEFIRHFTDIDPIVTQHLRYKHFLRIITDTTAQERTIIGRLIVEDSDPTPDEFTQLLEGQGAIQLSWKMSYLLANQSGLYPAIAAYYVDAKSHYATLYDMVHGMFYLPGNRHGASYPISADIWLELSTEATESLNELKAVSLAETQHYIEKLVLDSQQAIVLHLSVLLFTLTLCAYSFWLITHRVINPINRIIAALLDTMQEKPVAFEPLADNQLEEIKKLVQVLNAFQQNLEMVQNASAVIAHSENRYRALSEASAQVIWTWKQGGLDKTSPLAQWWEDVTGQPSEKIATLGWLELVHPDDRDHVQKIWEEAIDQKKNFEIEYRLRKRDGNYMHVAIRAVALLAADGSLHEFIGSLNDVTTRKEAEEKTALLAAVVEFSDDAIISKSLDGTILSWNAGAEYLFDYSADEAIGQHITLIIPPERMAEEIQIIAQIHAGKPVAHFDTVRRTKWGQLIDISLSVSPIRDATGKIIGASKTARDITCRKQIEAQLLRYTKELERSNQELDDFAYIASHDLKEPLRGLFNHATFLLEDYANKLDEDGVRRLHRLAHLSQRMEHLVNDLLYFSRLGRAELAIQKTDLNVIIADIEQMIESFLKDRNVRILVPQPLPTIVCDRPRVTEVFRNLITNAAKYNDKPERIIEVGFLDSVSTTQGDEKDVFYIKDNGIGIVPEFHQEIFRIFRRLQRATEGKEDGTGVGLTFVKKIIERHKGRIWLESELGQGTVFYFTLGRREP